MKKFEVNRVGTVMNEFNEPTSFREIKKHPSTIIIDKPYTEALLNIENCEYLDIVFYFHKSEGSKLSGITHSGEERGVFASRSPVRPNNIGITTVKLREREDNKLIVEGLDAINNTPVIDIKCCDTSLFATESDLADVHHAMLKTDPRIEIRNNINSERTDLLMYKAAMMHGHFCPGLAMGIMAGVYAMQKMGVDSDGMEDLLAITEINNCFADGIQLVTGCTFGNNALIYKDFGKTAFTLTKRDGKGIRICSRHESQEIIRQSFPDFQKYYREVVDHKNHTPEMVKKFKTAGLERAFGTLKIPFDRLFSVKNVNVEIPDYAAIHDSVICTKCGEGVMKNHARQENDKYFCLECKGCSFMKMDGQGIRHEEK